MKSRLMMGLAAAGSAALLASMGINSAPASATTALRATISVKSQVIIAGGAHTTVLTVRLFRGTKPVAGKITVLPGLSPAQAAEQKANQSCGAPFNTSQVVVVSSSKGFNIAYRASSHVGFCYLSAVAGSVNGQWKPQSWIMVAQKDPLLAAAGVHYAAALQPVKGGGGSGVLRSSSISQTCTNPLAVCKTWTLTVTHGGSPVPNVTVGQICVVDSPPSPPADSLLQVGCGPMTLTSPTTHLAATKTNASGQIDMTYTASNVAGNYDLWVQEASTGAKSQYVELKQF